MNRSLRILMTDQELTTWSGTKIVLRDFALRLSERGHDPVVYSPHLGAAAERFGRLGIAVVDDLGALSGRPDVIHGNHNIPTALALATFPGVPAIYFCHSLWWIDIPPRFERIHRYLPVDRPRYDFVTKKHGIGPDRVEILPNAIDLRRIPAREPPLPGKPRRALAFNKYKEHLGLLERACATRGIAFDAIGAGAGRIVDDPVPHLQASDIVFAIDRSAMEAICAGAAVILVEPRGMGGLVTKRRVKALRLQNFGHATLIHRLSPAAIGREIDRYDAADATAASATFRRLSDFDAAVDRIEELYAEALAAGIPKEWTDNDARGVSSLLEAWPVPGYDAAWEPSRIRLRQLLEANEGRRHQ